MKSKRFLVIAVFIVMLTAFIWFNSMMSKEDSGALSGGVMQFLKKFIDPRSRMSEEFFHHIVRKTAHFLEFFALGALYTFFKHETNPPYRERLVFLAPFAALFTAVMDEFIQLYTGRGSAVKDVVLDFSGALTAILLTELCLHIFRRTQK